MSKVSRLGSWLAVGMLAATLLGPAARAIAVPNNTGVVANGYSALEDNPQMQAKSWVYLQALVKCANYGALGMGNEQVLSGDWFGNNTGDSIPLGHEIMGETGSAKCGSGWLLHALDLWGITNDKRAFLCEISGNPNDTCATDPHTLINLQQSDANVVIQAVSKRFYGGGSTDLSPVQLYALNHDTFVIGCKATQIGLKSSLTNDQKTMIAADPSHYRFILDVDTATGDILEMYHKTEMAHDDNVAYAATVGDRSCQDIEKDSNYYANAYSQFVKTMIKLGKTVKDTNPASRQQGSDTVTCAGGALGWLLCPVMTLMNDVNTMIAHSIEGLLKVEALTKVDSRKAIEAIWRIIVGFANLMLVIAFLVVIFSQATSFGLSAYGVKKILPRIIVAAVLINLSLFICGILVDISNIVGGSVQRIIQTGIDAIPPPASGGDFSGMGKALLSSLGAVMAMIGIGAVAVAAVVTGAFAFVVPIVIMGVTATIVMFMAIALRQVLVILLIIVSPIAIAAMILPGTESIFKKWYKMFVQMLVFYPAVAAIMYGCVLMGKIIIVGAG